MIKCFFPSNIIYEECTCRTSVIAAGDALKRLLTGGVPNLELDVLVVDFDGSTAELDANGQIMLLPEALVREL